MEPRANEIELLDWENNPSDFDALCNVVIEKLDKWLKGRKAEDVLPLERLRKEIRWAAEHFEDRYRSLPFFVYMWMKQVLARELVGKKAGRS